jgi:hypothetical protein
VFGLAIGGFFIYFSLKYRRAEAAFLRGDAKAVSILIKKPERFRRFLERSIRGKSDEEIVKIAETYGKAPNNKDNDLPCLEELAEEIYVEYCYAKFRTSGNSHGVLCALTYYPKYGQRGRLLEILKLPEQQGVITHLPSRISSHLPGKDAADVLLHAIQNEDNTSHSYFISKGLERIPPKADIWEPHKELIKEFIESNCNTKCSIGVKVFSEKFLTPETCLILLRAYEKETEVKNAAVMRIYDIDMSKLDFNKEELKEVIRHLKRILLESPDDDMRAFAAEFLIGRLARRDAMDILLKALETEKSKRVLEIITFVLSENIEYVVKKPELEKGQNEKIFNFLKSKVRTTTGRPHLFLVKLMIKLYGKRGLIASIPIEYPDYIYNAKLEDIDARSSGVYSLAADALNMDDAILYFDNGDRVFGEVAETDNASLDFRTWQEKKNSSQFNEKIISMQASDFYLIKDKIPAHLNPYYPVMKKHIWPLRTESAVTASLRWLHFHQDRPEGRYDPVGFERNCRDGKCGGGGAIQFDTGATSLALLVFIKNKNYYQSGIFDKTMLRSLVYLRHIQSEDGTFGGKNELAPLEHALAVRAFAEGYHLTHDKVLKKIVEPALARLLDMRKPDGGWTAVKNEPSTATGTAFAVLALHSAKKAGFTVPDRYFEKARKWFDMVTDENGRVSATLPKTVGDATVLSSAFGRLGMAYTVFALSCENKQIKKMKALVKNILKDMPDKLDFKSRGESYFLDVYFNTLALSLAGEEHFKEWQKPFKEQLLKTQRRGGCPDGSWDPPQGGGVFSNRMTGSVLAQLAIDIYYDDIERRRKTNNKTSEPLKKRKTAKTRFNGMLDEYNPDYLAAAYDFAEWDERCKILFRLGTKWKDAVTPKARGLTLRELSATDDFVRANAVRALGNIGAKDAAAVIVKLKGDKSPFVRAMVKEALEKLE